MRVLLDTHSFLWFVGGNPRMPVPIRTLVADPDNAAVLSIVSVWEIALKTARGRLTLGSPFRTFIQEQTGRNRIELLPVTVDHLAQLLDLPFHHRDPFDRLLVAQALVEDLPLVSRDASLDAYGVARLW